MQNVFADEDIDIVKTCHQARQIWYFTKTASSLWRSDRTDATMKLLGRQPTFLSPCPVHRPVDFRCKKCLSREPLKIVQFLYDKLRLLECRQFIYGRRCLRAARRTRDRLTFEGLLFVFEGWMSRRRWFDSFHWMCHDIERDEVGNRSAVVNVSFGKR